VSGTVHRIERHALPLTAAGAAGQAEVERSILDDFLGDPIGRADSLGISMRGAQELLGYQIVAGAPASVLLGTARLAAQVGEALLRRAAADEPVTVAIGGGTFRFAPTGPSPEAGPVEWADAYYLASIAGERDIARRLAGVPVAVLRQGGASDDDVLFDRVHALQMSTTGERFEPPRVEASSSDYPVSVVVPEIEAIYALSTADALAFDAALGRGLAGHRAFVEAEAREGDPTLWYALGFLALTLEARRRELPVVVESGYLPLDRF